MDAKFCVNCKWHIEEIIYEGIAHTCHHPQVLERSVDLVTGNVEIDSKSCHWMRQNHRCAPEGYLFSYKEDNS